MSYASDMIDEALTAGPHDDDNFYRVKVWGSKPTKTFSASPYQLQQIKKVMAGRTTPPRTFDRMSDCWMIVITKTPGLASYDVPAFDHGWETRQQAARQRDAMVESGYFTYGQLTIKRFAVVPEEIA